VAAFNEQQDQLVAFVLDLTERKRAQKKARESERRYHEVAMTLAHTNRVATMGQLSASIAHEVSQPIAAAFTNAQAGLRWLTMEQPDVEEVRQALGRIVDNIDRAGEVIGRIGALIKKAPTRRDSVAMNDAIREVIALTLGEVTKNGAVVRTQLADGLPLIQADRVQLQQVILNLIINAVEAMAGVGEGPRELLISTRTAATGDVRVAVRDSGPGVRSRPPRTAVRGLLHHQARRFGHGPVDLPLDRRGAWRTIMGRGEQTAGSDLSVRGADAPVGGQFMRWHHQLIVDRKVEGDGSSGGRRQA
jgi:C4-dicarboxylate-specific signal transduction histidine kinase